MANCIDELPATVPLRRELPESRKLDVPPAGDLGPSLTPTCMPTGGASMGSVTTQPVTFCCPGGG
ncbi:MAG: hypothetical protein KC731_09885 [Myxococcales bacterium]|nr:hypothetical protein [Myxococcales bacterium]